MRERGEEGKKSGTKHFFLVFAFVREVPQQ